MTMKNVNKIKHLNFDVSDEMKWWRLEDFVENWMKKLKRDIHVKLTISFKKMNEITNSKRVDSSGKKEKERKIYKNC